MNKINALCTSCKESRKEEKANLITLIIYHHDLIKNNQIFSLNKLSSRELHNMKIIKTMKYLLLNPTTTLFSVPQTYIGE